MYTPEGVEEIFKKKLRCLGHQEDCQCDCEYCILDVSRNDEEMAYESALMILKKVDSIKKYLEKLNKSYTEDSDAIENKYAQGALDVADDILKILNKKEKSMRRWQK